MNKKKSLSFVWIFIIATVIFGSLFLLAQNFTKETLAQCMTRKGIVMYGHELCSNCANQKKLLGDDFRSITYINCQFEPEKCQAKGVTYYPVWFLGEKTLLGIQDPKNIAAFAGCPYPN